MIRTRTIYGVGLAGFLVYAYPGYLSYDSVLQLEQARAGHYTDWHPPVMALLWRVVELVVAGPFGMLLIQVACFTWGASVLLRRALAPRPAALATVALLWFPPIAATLAVIWKDSLMTGFFLVAIALLLDGRRSRALAGLAFVLLGTAVRYNAFTIALPIVCLLFVWDPTWRGARRYAVALAAWLIITGAALGLDRALTDEQTHVWQQSVALMDLGGTLRYAPLPDDEASAALAGVPLRADRGIAARAAAAYHPAWMWDEITSPGGPFAPATSRAQLAAIGRAWRRLVPAHVAAYLRYRADVFAQLLQLAPQASSSAYVWFTDVMDPEGSAIRISHDAAPGAIQSTLRDAMQWLGTTWLFRPIVYVVLALALVVPCRRQRDALALLLGGLFSTAALYVLAPTPDFRYVIWLVVSAPLVAILVIARARPRLEAA